jgi:hypothetical protein
MTPDLTDDDKAILAELLRETIEHDRFPLSPRVKGLRGMLLVVAAAAAAALAGGIGVAVAQTPTPSTSPGAAGTQTRCWDSANNQVRGNTSGSTVGGSAGTSSGASAGSTHTDSSTGSISSTGAGSPGAIARPAEAMGLPDCK